MEHVGTYFWHDVVSERTLTHSSNECYQMRTDHAILKLHKHELTPQLRDEVGALTHATRHARVGAHRGIHRFVMVRSWLSAVRPGVSGKHFCRQVALAVDNNGRSDRAFDD